VNAYVRRMARQLRIARRRGDLVAAILLEQRIHRALAR
jgi:hypothetical protein